jgi:GDP-4-dehydro-6-deoxy-D-mannose reductase
VTNRKVDLGDPNEINLLLKDCPPSQVYHLAGLIPPADPEKMWSVNVGGIVNLLQVLKNSKKNIQVLNVGSAAEYEMRGNVGIDENSPTGGSSLYGRTKWAQTQIALAFNNFYNLSIKTARTFNLIGPGITSNLVVGRIINMLVDEREPVVQLKSINSKRDFIDIRDAVAAYWEILNHGIDGEIYNVCSGKPTAIKDIYDMAIRVSGINKSLSVENERNRKSEIDTVFGDNNKLCTELGWIQKIDLFQSLKDMIDHNLPIHENNE